MQPGSDTAWILSPAACRSSLRRRGTAIHHTEVRMHRVHARAVISSQMSPKAKEMCETELGAQ